MLEEVQGAAWDEVLSAGRVAVLEEVRPRLRPVVLSAALHLVVQRLRHQRLQPARWDEARRRQARVHLSQDLFRV